MFKFVGFLLLALCLTGSFGEEPEEITTSDTFGNLSDFTTTTPEPEETSFEVVNTTNTTAAPETTKSEPVTTSANDTTPAPTTTTAAPPAQNTTTPEPTTTSSPVTPTSLPLPSPETGDWNVSDSKLNITCIRAKFAVQFKYFYNGEDYEHNLLPNATSDKSSCSIPDLNNTQILVLEDAGYILSLVFENDTSSSSVHHMTLFTPIGTEYSTNETQFEVKLGKSYLCNSKSNIKIDNATLAFSNVHLQAFMHHEPDFSTAEDCATDDKLNDIIPISVACVLCLMVVIILIGYLVTRRQSRQRGYQSV